MLELIAAIAVGIVLIVIGITNTRGNISTLHSYHRKRVREEDRIPFGKRVGLGTILSGAGVVVFGGFSIVAEKTGNNLFMIIGAVALVALLVVGLALMFAAMIKYNKGIF